MTATDRKTTTATRTPLMTAALSASPVEALASYATEDLRRAAKEGEAKLVEQMRTGEGLVTVAEIQEGLHRVEAVNIITREVMRRDEVAATAGPQGVCREGDARLTFTVLVF